MKFFALLITCFVVTLNLNAQNFSINDYIEFLENNQNMEYSQLTDRYPIGVYNPDVPNNTSILYLDSITQKYGLTQDELTLLHKHGFVVTERLSNESFWSVLKDIYCKDLPVFVTTDMIMHSIHKSYDAILMDIEERIFYTEIESILKDIRSGISNLVQNYETNEIILQSLKDLDVFVTIPLRILSDKNLAPIFNDNIDDIQFLENEIEKKSWSTMSLFSSTQRHLDFSQMTVRGHYTKSEALGKYFQALMWLGRIEFYLIPPVTADLPKQTPEDIRRQIIDAALINKILNGSDAKLKLDRMNRVIEAIVGEQDNVQLDHIAEILNEINVTDIVELTDLNVIADFQNVLANKPYADQKILSQILFSDPMSPEQLKPASSFMLFGQRFIIDSYVFASLVYDKILYKNHKVTRMLPKSLDILFAIGNNAAADFLESEIEAYKYSTNLSALRYLIDSYPSDFWQSSYYNSWLEMIRRLNAPNDDERYQLPKFMQTAAWWQQKMNTQLSSWIQLRHDNLLYAKQSYTGGAGCMFPYGYVEPELDFYKAVISLAENGKLKIVESLKLYNDPTIDRLNEYFEKLKDIAQNLYNISDKELKNIPFSDSEKSFLANTIADEGVCVEVPGGWYARLFYQQAEDMEEPDYLVADVHTAPTDASGNPVGWVLHGGTGDINTAIILAKNENGESTAFAGPVLSYHEIITEKLKRLTDEDWKDIYSFESSRPEFTKLYLADKNGNNKYVDAPRLPTRLTSVETIKYPDITMTILPNPMESHSKLIISVPSEIVLSEVDIQLFDLKGLKIADIYSGLLHSGSSIIDISPDRIQGLSELSTGVYIVILNINGRNYSQKLIIK